MALFPKMPAKKPAPPKPEGNGRHDPAPRAGGADPWRQSKPGGITITGFGLVEASPTRRVIEVTHANAGMCAVLENAVLLFASGHAGEARTLLTEGVESDSEAKRSSLAWLALFDLMQRAGDRQSFEQLALQYVVQFERSAPTWDDRIRPTPLVKSAAGGYIGVTGKLSAASAPQLEALHRAVVKNVSQARFDLAAITGFDDAGARMLAEILAEARRRRYPLRLQRSEKLRRGLEAAVAKGAAGGEGAWLLSLELLQWQNDRAAFDDRAVDYAVTFEVSPPSWEPPVLPQTDLEKAADSASAAASRDENEDPSAGAGSEMLAWTGIVAGAHPEQIGKLTQHADGREVVQVDLSQVERIDFVGAGAVFNAVKTIEEQRKTVQIFGATPIIRAMLLLIGITAGHFFKKAQ